MILYPKSIDDFLEFPWFYKFEALEIVRDGSDRTSSKNVKRISLAKLRITARSAFMR